mmetsp:Transcript_1596/g.3836  ORF Transcript_1596/g.3836 Transcript_1596/m.3836 type:complete len:107 (+) Transcript_1596:2152-2472(+)
MELYWCTQNSLYEESLLENNKIMTNFFCFDQSDPYRAKQSYNFGFSNTKHPASRSSLPSRIHVHSLKTSFRNSAGTTPETLIKIPPGFRVLSNSFAVSSTLPSPDK